jgi:hypothetical protein
MTVGITTGQFNNTGETSTRPIRVVRLEHSGSLELISENGDIEFNGELFSAGGIMAMSVGDGRRATLTLSGSATRIAESVAGRWRNGKICQIYAVPGLPTDTGVYDLEDGVLLLDGIIDSSEYSGGVVTVRAIHKHLRGNLTPRQTFNVYSQYIPAPGSIVEWGGESYVLRSRR